MKKFDVLGTKIDLVTLSDVLDFVDEAVLKKRKTQIATVNNEFIVEAQKNDEFKEVLRNSSLAVADSTGVVKAVKYLHGEEIERIPGADLFMEICKRAAKKGHRIYLLGGKNGVAQKAKDHLLKLYRYLHVVGLKDGIYISGESDNSKIIQDINRTKPDILFVGLGAPKQDIWINHNLEKLSCYVFIGVGGSLDYASNTIRRAPKAMREAGLEWLFRLIVQPKRIGRIFKATVVFPYLVFKSKTRVND